MLVEQEAELQHPRQEQQDDGHDERELDQALAALGLAVGSAATDEAAHRTGSMRMLLARSKLRLGPLNRVRIGVLYGWL